jgi:tryptophan-rich sensory protein
MGMSRLSSSFCLSKLITSVVICLGGGWVTGLFTNSGLKSWYPSLIKSSLTPPPIIFPIAWTILYLLMALSLYLVWVAPGKNKRFAFCLFGMQLFFNFIWSFIFFYEQDPSLALVDIVCLGVSIAATMIAFSKLSRPAVWLLVPYILWILFAFYLNLFIVIHN